MRLQPALQYVIHPGLPAGAGTAKGGNHFAVERATCAEVSGFGVEERLSIHKPRTGDDLGLFLGVTDPASGALRRPKPLSYFASTRLNFLSAC
jgi:hypothetical protein